MHYKSLMCNKYTQPNVQSNEIQSSYIMKRYIKNFAVMALAGLVSMPVLASPPTPTSVDDSFCCFPGAPAGYVNRIPVPSGKLHKKAKATKLGDSKWDNTDGHDIREVRTDGVLPVLVLLVEFADNHFSVNNGDPYPMVNQMLNGTGYTLNGATGSAFEYFQSVSSGQFAPRFDLYGPVRMSKNTVDYVEPSEKEYYPNPDPNSSTPQVEVYAPGRMVEEAIKALDDQINFADYDTNGDGYVDFVYIFHAGKGATTGGIIGKDIWPHAFTLTSAIGAPIELDGVKIDRYATSAELGTNNKLSGIGTFCHEFGHVLGFPDFYDTTPNKKDKNVTLGTFDCMDEGNYNNSEHTPPTYSGYERYALEWMKPTELSGSADITMLPLTARNMAYKFHTSNPQEYFIVETRAPHFNDRFIPSHGMAVWHIDFDIDIWDGNRPNNVQGHQRVDIVEADGDYIKSTRNGDFFPGNQSICEFLNNANPSFTDWSNKPVGYDITYIRLNPDGTTSFHLEASSGKEMKEAALTAPEAEITKASPNSFKLHWNTVENAKGYYVSVYDLSKFDGTTISEFVDGYYFKDLGNVTSIEITGLQPGKSYGAYIYAYNDFNASRMEYPLEIHTLGDTFEASAPNLYIYSAEAGVEVAWDEVADADKYVLTIGTPYILDQDHLARADFAESSLPEGWSSNAKYELRDRYCGEAVPALKCESNGSYLLTPRYDSEISSISFTGRIQYDDPYNLDLYSVDDKGGVHLIMSYYEMDTKMDCHFIKMPAGVHRLKLVYSMHATGQNLYMDDVELNFADYTYVPTDAEITYTSSTNAIVAGLNPDTEYVAIVTPYKSDAEGKSSAMYAFKPSAVPSGVEGIDQDLNVSFKIEGGIITLSDRTVPFDVYAIDGTAIASGARGSYTLPSKGIYILKFNQKRVKILF